MSISEISIAEFAALNDRVVIDVREVDEYVTGHVPGAINIALSELVGREDECGRRPVVYVICQSGGRSLRACGHLSTVPSLEGTTFINVAGGTGMWIVEGHEVTTGDTAS
jgi:rhodanese-related sulfurtransferase